MQKRTRQLFLAGLAAITGALVAGVIGALLDIPVLVFLAVAALVLGGSALKESAARRRQVRHQELLQRQLAQFVSQQAEQREALEGRVAELTAQVLHIVQTAENRAADDSGE